MDMEIGSGNILKPTYKFRSFISMPLFEVERLSDPRAPTLLADWTICSNEAF
jgi:hypothetical protein